VIADRPGEVERARRCSICNLNWPVIDVYKKCPSCDEPTSLCKNVTPLDIAEARSEKLRFDFEKYYQKWDDEHSPDRLRADADGATA
jgi:hypothetical protein